MDGLDQAKLALHWSTQVSLVERSNLSSAEDLDIILAKAYWYYQVSRYEWE